MKRKKKNLFIILIPIVLLLFACDSDRLAKGNQAPDFKLKSIDASDFKLSDYRGKVVLVHFWTDWCASCRAEFPRIQYFYSELKSDDFVDEEARPEHGEEGNEYQGRQAGAQRLKQRVARDGRYSGIHATILPSWQLAAVSWQQLQTAHCKLQTYLPVSRIPHHAPQLIERKRLCQKPNN